MSFNSNVTIMPGAADRYEKTGQFNLRTKTYTARTVTDCLLQAKQELGADAIIVSRKTFKKGAFLGRWGGREMVEMTFGTYLAPMLPPANPHMRYSGGEKPSDAEANRIQELEAKLAKLTESVQGLSESPAEKPPVRRPAAPFVPASLQAGPQRSGQESVAQLVAHEAAPPRNRRRKDPLAAPAAPIEEGYPGLMQQLLDADIATPLARQLISEVPAGLTSTDAATFLRTVLSQRLKIANGIDALPSQGKMKLLAFVGTTGVGKTTTIAKLTARYALMERRKVGVITLDTQRIGAAEQLQKYGEILRVPVKVAHDKMELIQHLEAFAAEGKEIVMLDTAGRSPNEMIPLGETAHLFDGVGSVQKYLTVPAVLGQRDMDNIVTKFQNIFTPDAIILTKIDEASDHTCFGRLLTLQAKFGLPLAFVTTGQRVPDDIVLPDAHAIASRILSSPLI
ncbi:MAG: flagellar biosynthesis protein FlhF [Janthinobacterium lividum]